MSVRLHIERLVIEGPALSARDRSVLADAVQRELSERLASRSRWPASDVRVRRVRDVPMLPARSLASGIAGAVDHGIGRVTER